MRRTETRYAELDDSYIAYQILGEGPIDIVQISGWVGHVEAQWDYPALARYLERLASFGRVICFDRRGQGMSDPIDPDNITLEQWMEDVRVVMDAAGSERAALIGPGEGGPLAVLFAATYPERTSSIVLINTWATMLRHEDYPSGMPKSANVKMRENFKRSYLDHSIAEFAFSHLTPDPRDAEMLRRLTRFALSPRAGAKLSRFQMDIDIRDTLPAVRVPTLVLHRAENAYSRVGHGRYLAEHIAGAKYVELSGAEQYPWSGDQDEMLDEIQEFTTGARPAPEADRVLSTVLFTDICVSTERAAAVGDRKWKDLLNRHDVLVERELDRHRGRKVNPTGDGVLATFDGPARAVRCASAIRDAVRELAIAVRCGVHTGEIELRGNDVSGIAVHIGQRVSGLAGEGEVLVSRTVVDLVAGSGLEFDDRGEHQLKGVPGRWQLFAVK